MLRHFLRLISLAALVAASFAGPRVVWAEPDSVPGPGSELLKAQVKQNIAKVGGHSQGTNLEQTAPKPIGLAGAQIDGKTATEFQESTASEDIGDTESLAAIPMIKPMQGFTQLLNSEDLQKFYKASISMKVPVLFETMMMVENGAATGTLGALSNVNGVMASTMQASALQLQYNKEFDPTGLRNGAYARAIFDQINQGDQKDAWPLALWAAGADVVDPNNITNKDVKYQYNAAGNGAAGTSADVKIDPQGKPDPSSLTEKMLSAILFDDAQKTTGDKAYSNTKIGDLKKEFVALLGDYKFKVENKGGAQLQAIDYVTPTPRPDNRKILQGLEYDYTKDAWKGIQNLLKAYCTFKKTNPNDGKPLWTKDSPYKGVIEKNLTDAEAASSVDIPLTINFLDQLFKMWMQNKSLDELDCDQQFDPSPDNMPAAEKAINTGSSFDNCEGKTGQYCLRNRVVHNFVKLVARSRVLHRYVIIRDFTLRFTANDEKYDDLIWGLFERQLGGADLDEEVGVNKLLWVDYSNFISRLAQGQVSSAMFRPGAGSNVPNSSPDKAR